MNDYREFWNWIYYGTRLPVLAGADDVEQYWLRIGVVVAAGLIFGLAAVKFPRLPVLLTVMVIVLWAVSVGPFLVWAAQLTISASDQYYLDALWQVMRERMVSRKVPVKNLHRGKVEPASGGSVRQEVELKQGISPDTCRAIVKLIKDAKLKKVQSQIQ